jgi:hypothetical protein
LRDSGDELVVRIGLVMANVDYKLMDRQSVVQFLGTQIGLKVSDSLVQRTGKMDDSSFMEFVKMTMVMRRWFKEDSADSSVYKMFEAMMQSRMELSRTWFTVSQSRPWPMVWSSLLTFFARASEYESQGSVSDAYRKLLFAARDRFTKHQPKLMSLIKLRRVREIHILSALLDTQRG